MLIIMKTQMKNSPNSGKNGKGRDENKEEM